MFRFLFLFLFFYVRFSFLYFSLLRLFLLIFSDDLPSTRSVPFRLPSDQGNVDFIFSFHFSLQKFYNLQKDVFRIRFLFLFFSLRLVFRLLY